MPDLRAELVNHIIENLGVLDAVGLCQDYDDRHLERECDPEVVKDRLLNLAVFLCAVLSIDNDEGVVREVDAEASHQSLGVSLVSSYVNESDDLAAVLHDLGP